MPNLKQQRRAEPQTTFSSYASPKNTTTGAARFFQNAHCTKSLSPGPSIRRQSSILLKLRSDWSWRGDEPSIHSLSHAIQNVNLADSSYRRQQKQQHRTANLCKKHARASAGDMPLATRGADRSHCSRKSSRNSPHCGKASKSWRLVRHLKSANLSDHASRPWQCRDRQGRYPQRPAQTRNRSLTVAALITPPKRGGMQGYGMGLAICLDAGQSSGLLPLVESEVGMKNRRTTRILAACRLDSFCASKRQRKVLSVSRWGKPDRPSSGGTSPL